LTHQKNPPADSIDQLTEIQRLRQVALSKEQTDSRLGETDGPR